MMAMFIAGFGIGGTAALLYLYIALPIRVKSDLEKRYGEQVAEEIWENKGQDLKVVEQ